MNLLFVCTYNIQRSRTAEDLFAHEPAMKVKSAGVESEENPLTAELVEWADYIFVMEEWHRDFITEKFGKRQRIVNLDIPDIYHYMDPVLIAILEEKMNAFFNPEQD